MVKIKRIGVLSCGKLFGALYALMGLVFGVLMALVSFAGAAFNSSGLGVFGIFFGVGAIIMFPVFYGVLGFIFASLTALAYNVVASWIGGIEVETE